MSFKEASKLREQLNGAWSNGKNADLDKCGELLDQLKLVLTKLHFLPESPGKSAADRENLELARDMLEIGALWSILKKDIPSFERYMSQLKCYYLDYKNELKPSAHMHALLSLNLMCLLSQNCVSEFHTELELCAHPDVQVLQNKYIKYAISIEQYLMEGRYNKIFQARQSISPEYSQFYNFFIDTILETMRDEIATAIEKSYDRLHVEAAASKLNISGPKLAAYTAKRNWVLGRDNYYIFANGQRAEDVIPSYELATNAIKYAKELDMIV